jgi:hypothetical protein
MNFDDLDALRRANPAWRLLCADHAPLLLSIDRLRFVRRPQEEAPARATTARWTAQNVRAFTMLVRNGSATPGHVQDRDVPDFLMQLRVTVKELAQSDLEDVQKSPTGSRAGRAAADSGR